MFCKHCGSKLSENPNVCLNCLTIFGKGNKFCPHCGAKHDSVADVCVKCGCSLNTNFGEQNSDNIGRLLQNSNVHTFKEAILTCFSKFANFDGRACRAEFWYWSLFVYGVFISIICIVTFCCDDYLAEYTFKLNVLCGMFWLVILMPSLSVSVRRLHDINKSGWWYFVRGIPIIGMIIWLVLMCLDSYGETNKYGTNPKHV